MQRRGVPVAWPRPPSHSPPPGGAGRLRLAAGRPLVPSQIPRVPTARLRAPLPAGRAAVVHRGPRRSEDVWTRAAPLLAFVFLGELFGAIAARLVAARERRRRAGGLAILVGASGSSTCCAGRRFWSLPQDVGNLELAAFVLVPAALPLIFGGQVGSAP